MILHHLYTEPLPDVEFTSDTREALRAFKRLFQGLFIKSQNFVTVFETDEQLDVNNDHSEALRAICRATLPMEQDPQSSLEVLEDCYSRKTRDIADCIETTENKLSSAIDEHAANVLSDTRTDLQHKSMWNSYCSNKVRALQHIASEIIRPGCTTSPKSDLQRPPRLSRRRCVDWMSAIRKPTVHKRDEGVRRWRRTLRSCMRSLSDNDELFDHRYEASVTDHSNVPPAPCDRQTKKDRRHESTRSKDSDWESVSHEPCQTSSNQAQKPDGNETDDGWQVVNYRSRGEGSNRSRRETITEQPRPNADKGTAVSPGMKFRNLYRWLQRGSDDAT